MLTETFLRYGQPSPPAELVPLKAGPLALLFDPASGFVRRIKLGEREVLRGIYAAVRDRNWVTVPGKLREVVRNIESQSFHIEFESEHQQRDIHFIWRGVVSGDASGKVSYEFDGAAKTTFLRNRIGFCVLHPIQCAGARARQSCIDGTEVECRFPELIEPQIFGRSSFRELRSVMHEVMPGVWAKVEFSGDTFEMEDQRNWTDASFKTYCTPLALPFPVEIKAGSRVRQTITFCLDAEASKILPQPIEVVSQSEPIRLTIPDKPTATLLRLGLGVASHGEPLNENELTALRQLRLSHLRADVHLAASDCVEKLTQASHEAARLNARLELALHLPRKDEADPRRLLHVINQENASVARILALREGEAATSAETLAWVKKYFGALGAPVGSGTDCFFCELNRERALGRLGMQGSDFLFWSINPQFHAIDHLSIVETLEAQAVTVNSARAFAAGRPLVVSPVTLKQRFNPVATGAADPTPPGELPPQVDARQLSQFAAAWTLGSIAALTAANVESVTYYETTGWRGLMEQATGSQLPEKFPSQSNTLFPVYQIFLQLAGFQQITTVALPSSELSALALFKDNRLKRVMVANLSESQRDAEIEMPFAPAKLAQLQPYEVWTTDAQT